MTAPKGTFTVGIAGLTGKFSGLVASFLLQRPNVTLRGYVRDTSKLPSSLSPNARIHITQGSASDVSAARTFARGCDIVICGYLGDNRLMREGQKVLIDACEAEGVPRYIASDYSLDFTKLEKGQLFPKDPMIEVKEYLDGKRVKGVHVLIGVFMDTFFTPYMQIWDEKEKKLRFWGEEDEMWEATSYKTAAEFVAAVAVDAEATGVKKFLGDRKTIRQIADAVNSMCGFRPQLERLGSLDDLYKLMHELREKYPQDPLKYVAMFYQYYCVNGQCHLGEFASLDNARYPEIRPETFEDFLRVTSLETVV
ncbi:hypothetical protein H2201_002212 [Coniosporium apollinis]|uniref:NAD(P)-binding domain-containing protein n=1 Tax=Coniosporium apollinis TaxID=61459 RepID=A0ABQ9NZV2_9PEZI|nr:hypothetical protein H2201_002212 [Coniosporium apollinis]